LISIRGQRECSKAYGRRWSKDQGTRAREAKVRFEEKN
jgi:hypothetical protein